MKFYPTKYEGYFVSKTGEIVSYRKPSSCKKCLYNGKLYESILDALKDVGMTYNYFRRHRDEISNKILFEGVETIEIRKVSRVGRKWLPVEVHPTVMNKSKLRDSP